MRAICLFMLFLIGCTATPQHDQTTYQRMNTALAKDLRGIPFDTFVQKLNLSAVPYDEIYTNQPNHTRRLYHLEGFALDVSIEDRDGQAYTDSHFFPALGIDGLNRQQRLEESNHALDEYFAERARMLEQTRRNAREHR